MIESSRSKMGTGAFYWDDVTLAAKKTAPDAALRSGRLHRVGYPAGAASRAAHLTSLAHMGKRS